MEIRYPDDFIKYYDTDDEIVEVGEFELLYPDNYELKDINDESDDSSFRPFGGNHGEHGGHGWHSGHGWYGGHGSHGFPGWHAPGWVGWYGPWLWPILWPEYCPGPDCPCPGDECPCPGPDCPCYGPDCPRADFITSYDSIDGYRTIPKSIYDISNKIKNFSGNIYDSFKPPLSSDPNPRQSGPVGPPPSYIPSKNDKNIKFITPQTTTLSATPQSVSPGSISFCLFKFTYIWQTNGRAYWSYLLRIDRHSISGFRWAGWRWVYFGLDLRRIEAFIC